MNSSRLGGCTLTGAISVISHIRDAVTVVHGPKGCSHHNLSLLHATWLENDEVMLPELIPTALSESEVIFGGENALRRTLRDVAGGGPAAIFVLSTCIAGTIGDDTEAVCSGDYGIPVIPVPTAGFLGGTFQEGVNNALVALAGIPGPCRATGDVNIIGEMNLEYEVEENYREIARLLGMLGLSVNLRFVHRIAFDEIPDIGGARLNILRDPALLPVGEFLRGRFGTPFIPGFPSGFSETLAFLANVASACGIDGNPAVGAERRRQADLLAGFSDLRGMHAAFDRSLSGPDAIRVAEELASLLEVSIGETEGIRLPVSSSVGTAGSGRMLHRWRRAARA